MNKEIAEKLLRAYDYHYNILLKKSTTVEELHSILESLIQDIIAILQEIIYKD